MSALLKALAILCPPLAVALVEGITMHVFWSIIYTLCLYIPGAADAWMAVAYRARQAEARRLFHAMGPQRILFVGRGAIATVLGWALARAGHRVDYLVRPKHLKTYKDSLAVDILDCRGRLFGRQHIEQYRTPLIGELPAGHDYTLIIISVQCYNFASTVQQLAPRIGPKAIVLGFNNLWLEPLDAIKPIPTSQVAWGFPTAGGGFRDNDHFIGAAMASLVFGTFGTDPLPHEQRVRDIFRSAGFAIQEERDFRGWIFAHFIVIGAVLQEVMNAGNAAAFIRSGAHRSNLVANIRELIPLLEARGVPAAGQSQMGLAKAPAWVVSAVLKLMMHFEPVRRGLAENSNPLDAPLTTKILLEDAEARGIPVPRLAASVAQGKRNGMVFEIPSPN